MSWLDRIAADTAMSPRAWQLARIIAERFAHNSHASFYDVDIGAFLDLPSGDIRALRYQLQNAGYLHPLQSGNCKPAYQLRFGRSIEADGGGEAA